MTKRKEKFKRKLYVFQMENDEFLFINSDATDEEGLFITVADIDNATYLNKANKVKIENVIAAYSGYLFIGNERQYIKPKKLLHFGLLPLDEQLY